MYQGESLLGATPPPCRPSRPRVAFGGSVRSHVSMSTGNEERLPRITPAALATSRPDEPESGSEQSQTEHCFRGAGYTGERPKEGLPRCPLRSLIAATPGNPGSDDGRRARRIERRPSTTTTSVESANSTANARSTRDTARSAVEPGAHTRGTRSCEFLPNASGTEERRDGRAPRSGGVPPVGLDGGEVVARLRHAPRAADTGPVVPHLLDGKEAVPAPDKLGCLRSAGHAASRSV